MENHLLRALFAKYTPNSKTMNLENFTLFILKLQKIDPKLHKANLDITPALFAYISNSEELNFSDLLEWWELQHKYSFFFYPISNYLIRAYTLFQEFSTNGTMKYLDFLRFIENQENNPSLDLSEIAFDLLDRDSNGVIGFREFCNWLKWF